MAGFDAPTSGRFCAPLNTMAVNSFLRHISIRVPWHDSGWNGTVCKEPKLNGACLKLKRIAADRDDDAEQAVRGQSLKVLPQEQ